jgi:hypothetical protein
MTARRLIKAESSAQGVPNIRFLPASRVLAGEADIDRHTLITLNLKNEPKNNQIQ